jgi:flagella synthesis protein FlgN
MGIRPDIQERARSIIARDIESIGLLQQLLAEEQQALAARDLSAINAVVPKKLECLKALDGLERERKALTAQSGLREWNRLLAAADPGLLVEWKALAVKLRELAETTATTEKIVSRARHGTQRLLALMRGQGNEATGVYDRSGRTRGQADNRPITLA